MGFIVPSLKEEKEDNKSKEKDWEESSIKENKSIVVRQIYTSFGSILKKDNTCVGSFQFSSLNGDWDSNPAEMMESFVVLCMSSFLLLGFFFSYQRFSEKEIELGWV